MRCPWCGHSDDKVVDSRAADRDASIRRRRECLSCGRRFTTFERVEQIGLMVVKRDDTREPWDRAKLLAGVSKAFGNREVEPERLDRFVERVEQRLRRKGPEVTSQQVGVEVLQGLQKLDQVAYLRFASVYKAFESAEAFEDEIAILRAERAVERIDVPPVETPLDVAKVETPLDVQPAPTG
jgi:transcriptional repressor NrdR